MIGSLRRECLDHVIVLNERSLHRHLQRYLAYYHEWRTHLALDKDAPVSRTVTVQGCVPFTLVLFTLIRYAPVDEAGAQEATATR